MTNLETNELAELAKKLMHQYIELSDPEEFVTPILELGPEDRILLYGIFEIHAKGLVQLGYGVLDTLTEEEFFRACKNLFGEVEPNHSEADELLISLTKNYRLN